MRSALLILAAPLAAAPLAAQSFGNEWVEFHVDQSRLSGFPIVDPSTEVDYAWSDLDQNGWTDVVVVRKQVFTSPGKRTNVLLMNYDGVLTNMTSTLAVASDVAGDFGFETPTNDRDVVIVDVDNDGWEDVVTATTISDGDPKALGHPRVYMNLGEDAVTGDWLGLRYEEARIPQLLHFVTGQPENPRFCSVAAGDVNDDGLADLYFGDYDSSGAGGNQQPADKDMNDRLLINQGGGFFADESTARMTVQMLISAFGMAVVIEDMNLDGYNDIVKDTALNPPQYVAATYNNPGAPGFFSLFDDFHTFSPYHINTGDLNNDGRPDLVISDDFQDRYRYNLDTDVFGRVVWGPAKTYTYLASPDNGFNSNNLVADLDGDGWNDVIACDVDVDIPGAQRRTRIYHNPGGAVGEEITLVEEREDSTNNGWIGVVGWSEDDAKGGHDIAVFDVDRDGDNDMLFGQGTGDKLWLNDTDPVTCQPDLGFAGPGSATLSACGTPMHALGSTDILLTGAATNSVAVLFYGTSNLPVPVEGGTLVPFPWIDIAVFTTDGNGEVSVPGYSSAAGPLTLYLQFVIVDPSVQLSGLAFSNAIALELLK